MSKQEAIDFFNKGDLVGSEKIFTKLLESSDDVSEQIFALEYLEQIYTRINLGHLAKTQKKLLTKYYQEKQITQFLNTYEKVKNKTFDLKKIYLEILWERKDLSVFDSFAQEVSTELLTDKIFVNALEFYEWLKSKRKWFLYPYFGSLIMSLEIQKYDVAAKDINQIIELIDNKWSKIENKKKKQKEYYEHLLDIIGKYELNDIELLKKVRELRFKTAILNPKKIKLGKKDVIDYIISFSKEPEKLLWVLPFLDNENSERILSHIKSHKRDIKFSTESPFKNLVGKYFEKVKNIKIAKNSNVQYYPNSYNVENIKDVYDESVFDEYYIEKDEDVEVAERHFISLMKVSGNEYQNENSNLAVALMELGLYQSAQTLVEKTKKTLDIKYLELELLFRKDSFSEVIVEVNDILENNFLSESERIPFYYLKAYSYLKIGKKEAAQNIFSIIYSFNPDFRSIKEKLVNE